jgi:hypothetical protein
MSVAHLEAMSKLAENRAEHYLHTAKRIVLEQFGPASEHTHTEVTVALATAMMQHEGAQIVADAFRAVEG